MGTSLELPHPDVCRAEKFVASADYWACLVADPDPCRYVLTIGEIRICSIASRSGTQLKRKIENRKIPVRYADSSVGAVARGRLDELIESGGITAFERSNGWVDIAKDPIRSRLSQWQFRGLQRRVGHKCEETPPVVRYNHPVNRLAAASSRRKP